MGVRLLPLLALLLGAAGPDPAEPTEPPPGKPPSPSEDPRPTPSRTLQQPPSLAAPRAVERPPDPTAAEGTPGAGWGQRATTPPPPERRGPPLPETPTAAQSGQDWLPPERGQEATQGLPPPARPVGVPPPAPPARQPARKLLGPPPPTAVEGLVPQKRARVGSAAPQTGGPEEIPHQPVGSEVAGHSGRTPGVPPTSPGPPQPVGGLLPGTAPRESRAPPRSREGPELAGREAGRGSLGQGSSGWEWQQGTAPAPPPSPGAATAAPLSQDNLPSGPQEASPSVPTPSTPPGREALPTASPTGELGTLGPGQDTKGGTTAPLTPTGLVTGPSTELPLQPPGAPKGPAAHPTTTEPLRPPRPDPAEPPPALAKRPEEGPPPSPATRSSSAGTAQTQEGPPPQAAPTQAHPPGGRTPGTLEPPLRWSPGKGQPTPWRAPRPTEDSASSASAAVALRGGSAPAGVLQPPSQTGALSTSPGGEKEALAVTPPLWPPPAGTWGRGGGGPLTESPGREGSLSPPPPPAAGKAWQTWPPGRGEPPVASTRLLGVQPEAATLLAPAPPREGHPRAQHIFVAENQPPVWKAALLHLPWELVLPAETPGSAPSPEDPGLLRSLNATVAPLFAPLPGFQRLEVKSTRPGGVVVLLDAVFRAEGPGWWSALKRLGLPGLGAANASVIWSLAPARPLDPCAELFSCPPGYDCLVAGEGSATCASVCHRAYCKNQGICTHSANQTPVCQCPAGSDFWFLGVRCDYRVTQQGLLGGAAGLLLSLLLLGAAILGLVVRRVRRLLLLEARADQTKSSYRRFCRLDDVSAHYWSEPWLASVSSLDNPAFSDSEELLHLQTLQPAHHSCPEGPPPPAQGLRKPPQGAPAAGGSADRPRSLCSWEQGSSGSAKEHLVDSGKASDVSVSSWPLEPIQWSPSPACPAPARPPTHKRRRRPHSCEGMELVNLERSWTA